MSAVGHKLPRRSQIATVRFTPESCRGTRQPARPLRANNRRIVPRELSGNWTPIGLQHRLIQSTDDLAAAYPRRLSWSPRDGRLFFNLQRTEVIDTTSYQARRRLDVRMGP
jgi:hypothetical protein